MECTNEMANIEALLRTARTIPADAAQPPSALGLSDATLANWHKRKCHSRDRIPVKSYPLFHDTITINGNNEPGASPVRKKERKCVWKVVPECGIVTPTMKADGNQAKKRISELGLCGLLVMRLRFWLSIA